MSKPREFWALELPLVLPTRLFDTYKEASNARANSEEQTTLFREVLDAPSKNTSSSYQIPEFPEEEFTKEFLDNPVCKQIKESNDIDEIGNLFGLLVRHMSEFAFKRGIEAAESVESDKSFAFGGLEYLCEEQEKRIAELEAKLAELEEYKWKYEDLCK